jgi:hypothetical protein
MTWKPRHFLTVALAGWMNRQQQEAIEYLRTENRIFREKLGDKRILLDVVILRSPTRRRCSQTFILPTFGHAPGGHNLTGQEMLYGDG